MTQHLSMLSVAAEDSVSVPAPTLGSSQWPGTSVSRDPITSSGFLRHTCVHGTQHLTTAHNVQIHTNKSANLKISDACFHKLAWC